MLFLIFQIWNYLVKIDSIKAKQKKNCFYCIFCSDRNSIKKLLTETLRLEKRFPGSSRTLWWEFHLQWGNPIQSNSIKVYLSPRGNLKAENKHNQIQEGVNSWSFFSCLFLHINYTFGQFTCLKTQIRNLFIFGLVWCLESLKIIWFHLDFHPHLENV